MGDGYERDGEESTPKGAWQTGQVDSRLTNNKRKEVKNMKKILMMVAVILVSIFVGFELGATAVIHSDGWIDTDRQEFVIDFAGNYYAWDISEE